MLTFLRKIRKSLIEPLHANEGTAQQAGGSSQKYLLYAIGEIVLVVIGILIALQINNWNESRKNHDRNKNNIKGLMVDLRNDSIQLSTSLIRIEKDLKIIESFRNRLTQTESNLDTLIQIARHEFSPIVSGSRLENNSTYDILVMSGEVNLFDRIIIEGINAYYSFYDEIKASDNEHWNLYLNSVQQYTEYFTHKRTLINDGPLTNAIWESTEITDLLPKFNKWAATKHLYYTQRKGRLKNLREMNAGLISLLKENYTYNE